MKNANAAIEPQSSDLNPAIFGLEEFISERVEASLATTPSSAFRRAVLVSPALAYAIGQYSIRKILIQLSLIAVGTRRWNPDNR